MLETPNRHAWQQRAAHLKLHLAQAGKISPIVQFASRLSLGYQPKADSSDIELLKAIKAASLGDLTDIIAADAIGSLAQNRIIDDHDDRDFDAASLKSLGDAVAEHGAQPGHEPLRLDEHHGDPRAAAASLRSDSNS
jgi:hypothetical protein